jgi:hypothetical protein
MYVYRVPLHQVVVRGHTHALTPLLPEKETLSTQLRAGWVGPQTSTERAKKTKSLSLLTIERRFPGRPTCNFVIITTELSWVLRQMEVKAKTS